MKNALVLFATAVSCLLIHPAYSQSMGSPFRPVADANIPWHPVSIYIDNACKQIRANWNPPCAEDAKSAVVTFIIDMHGKPIAIKLKASSGVQLLDKLALDSVRKCTSFGEVPQQRKDPMLVELQFSTNLPNYYYGPEYDRRARVVLLADKDEPVSQDLAKYPLDLEEKLVELWTYEAELKHKKSVFCVYRVKVAEDGAVEQCHLLKMPNDSWMLGQRDFKMEAAALALISANKKLLPLPPGSKSRYLFLSFSARRHSYEKSIIVYKSQTPAVKRFSDNVDKLVLSHWCPAPGESLDGTVYLEVVLDAKGNIKELETKQRSGGPDNVAAAKRALSEALPIVPPVLDGSINHLYMCFKADEDPATWKVFHRYFSQELEGYSAIHDPEKTEENFARRIKGVISSRQ